MKVEFTGRHFSVTPAIKKHAKEQLKKIEKVLESKEISTANFILSVEKYRHQAELLISWRDQSLSCSATTTDMYVAIDQVVEKMARQALKLKDKLTTKARKARGEVKQKVAEETAAEPAAKTPRIIKPRNYEVRPMSPEEAAFNLGTSEDHFCVFRDSQTGKVGIIYKRKDGNYGLIIP